MYRNDRCETCLSIGRKMCHIDEDQLQSICPGFQLSVTNSSVCWECCGMVYKWIKFRDRVVKAQETLADYNTLNFTSMSTLSIKRHDPISIDPTNASDEISDLEVKDEHMCKDDMEISAVDNSVIDSEDSIAEKTEEDHPVPQLHNNLTPIRVYVKESNTQTKLISTNPVKSCIKKTEKHKSKRQTEKKVVFIKDGSETETADEFEDEVTNKVDVKDKETFKIVRVEKNKLLKLMGRARKKQWFNLSKQPKCEFCVMLFKNEDSLKQHLQKHKESSGAHACEVCQQRFTTIERVKTHEDTHFNKCIECIECHELFVSPWDFSVHFKHRHSKMDIMCWKCIKMFDTLLEYREHRRKVHRPLCTCEHCGKKIVKTSLKAHIKSVHTEAESTECPICYKMIKGDMKQLEKTHMRNVHGPTIADEDCFCVECNKQFRTIWRYRSHVKTTHENVRSKCPECGKSYISLRLHMLTHSNVFKYPCPECNKKFKWRSAMQRHLKYHHHGVPKPKTKTCNVCQKSFCTNKILRDHIHTHTGERPYVCATCGDTFGHKAALFTHNKLKHRTKTTQENK